MSMRYYELRTISKDMQTLQNIEHFVQNVSNIKVMKVLDGRFIVMYGVGDVPSAVIPNCTWVALRDESGVRVQEWRENDD